MTCECPKIDKSPLWNPLPEFRHPTQIQSGENIECYAARAGSQSGLKNDIGPQLPDRIANTFFATNLAGLVGGTEDGITFTTTSGTETAWSFLVDGEIASESPLSDLDWNLETGQVTGTVPEELANKAYRVTVTALNGESDLDTRVFTFYPKYAGKDDTIKLLPPLQGEGSGENAKWRVSCKFGPRTPPVAGASSMHNGWDMAYLDRSAGPILAAGDGKVVKAGPATGFGNWIVIEHRDAQNRLVCTTVYGHMNVLYVKAGDSVYAGQKIALVGNAGIGTGRHLHFEVHKGAWRKPTDPEPYITGGMTIYADNDTELDEDGIATPIDGTQYIVINENVGMTTGEARANDQCPTILPDSENF